MWYVPTLFECGEFDAREVRGFGIFPDAEPLCCEWNVDCCVALYGGQKIESAYLLRHRCGIFQLVRHFVWEDEGVWYDVTPFDDGRAHNICLNTKTLRAPNVFVGTMDTSDFYYVYAYVDPTTGEPFYIGKGIEDRAYYHLMNIRSQRANRNKTRFKNKVESLKAAGTPPEVRILVQNIRDEEAAYLIEEQHIRKYGRKGYDEGGILLNVCMSSRPPNHKGKTYQDIYGDQAQEQIEKRRALQIAAGGYGPKQHSDTTKKILSERLIGNKRRLGKTHDEASRASMRAGHAKRGGVGTEKQKIAAKIAGEKRRGISVPQGKWYNNGETNTRCVGDPPEGFVPGRLSWKKGT
jgi:hypothetical protein